MAGYQNDDVGGCRKIVEAKFEEGGGYCHCHRRLSFVQCKGDEQVSMEREIEGDCKYTDPRQTVHLCCCLCQRMFPGKPWRDRARFHELAHVLIKNRQFDATASWEERLKMARDLEDFENLPPFDENALQDFENLPPFDENALRDYLDSKFMAKRYIFDEDDNKVFGNMAVGDYIALMRAQGFRDMNTGICFSLDKNSILRPSPDKRLVGGNYDNGNVQFVFEVLNWGRNTIDDAEFRASLQTLYSEYVIQ